MSSVEPPYAIQPYMSHTELAHNNILLKMRWAIHETGTELQEIKIRKHSIYVKGELHGTLDTDTNEYHTHS